MKREVGAIPATDRGDRDQGREIEATWLPSDDQDRICAFSLPLPRSRSHPPHADAQTRFPNRTIKIVVPAPPGANLDTIPRIIADKLSSQWGHPVIIEHRPGAAQNLGAEVVARSEPDGYTLLATPQGPLVISQHFFAKLGFDPAAFTPVSIIASQPLVLVAHPKFRAA